MNLGLRLLVVPMLYIFTATAFAHPGPHTHVGVPEAAWHAFIGWEFALAACVAGAAGLVIFRLLTTRSQ